MILSSTMGGGGGYGSSLGVPRDIPKRCQNGPWLASGGAQRGLLCAGMPPVRLMSCTPGRIAMMFVSSMVITSMVTILTGMFVFVPLCLGNLAVTVLHWVAQHMQLVFPSNAVLGYLTGAFSDSLFKVCGLW